MGCEESQRSLNFAVLKVGAPNGRTNTWKKKKHTLQRAFEGANTSGVHVQGLGVRVGQVGHKLSGNVRRRLRVSCKVRL